MIAGSLRGVPVSDEPRCLAPKLPSAVRVYRWCLDPVDAALVSGLSLAAAPSGSGELAVSGLGFASGVTRSDGGVSDALFKVRVDPVLATDQAPAAPSAGFGTPLTWSAS